MIVTARWTLPPHQAGNPAPEMEGPAAQEGNGFMAEYAILTDEAEWGQATPEWIQQVAKDHGSSPRETAHRYAAAASCSPR